MILLDFLLLTPFRLFNLLISIIKFCLTIFNLVEDFILRNMVGPFLMKTLLLPLRCPQLGTWANSIKKVNRTYLKSSQLKRLGLKPKTGFGGSKKP